jgi:hypothetical protein
MSGPNHWEIPLSKINKSTNMPYKDMFINLADASGAWKADVRKLCAKLLDDPSVMKKDSVGIITLKDSNQRNHQYIWMKLHQGALEKALDKSMSQESHSNYDLALQEVFGGFTAEPTILIEVDEKQKRLTGNLIELSGVFKATKEVDLLIMENSYALTELPIDKSFQKKRNFKLNTVFFVDIWELESSEKMENVMVSRLKRLWQKFKIFESFMIQKAASNAKIIDCHALAFVVGDSTVWEKSIAVMKPDEIQKMLSFLKNFSCFSLPLTKNSDFLSAQDESELILTSNKKNNEDYSRLLTNQSLTKLKQNNEMFQNLPNLSKYLQNHFTGRKITVDDIVKQENSQIYLRMKTDIKLMTESVILKGESHKLSDHVSRNLAHHQLAIAKHFEGLGCKSYENWLFEVEENEQIFTGNVHYLTGILLTTQKIVIKGPVFFVQNEIVIKKNSIIFTHCFSSVKSSKIFDDESVKVNKNEYYESCYAEVKEFLEEFLENIIKFEEILTPKYLTGTETIEVLLFLEFHQDRVEQARKELNSLLDDKKKGLLQKLKIVGCSFTDLMYKKVLPAPMRKKKMF